jgi:hypothetical protein
VACFIGYALWCDCVPRNRNIYCECKGTYLLKMLFGFANGIAFRHLICVLRLFRYDDVYSDVLSLIETRE